jgi:hypothetical protein
MAKKKTRDVLVVGSKVKGYIKSKGMKTAGDALDGLNEKVYCLLDAAIARTKTNKRSTVRPGDM